MNLFNNTQNENTEPRSIFDYNESAINGSYLKPPSLEAQLIILNNATTAAVKSSFKVVRKGR